MENNRTHQTKTLIGNYQDSGMKMVDIELYEKSLKASWIQKLFGKQNYVNPIAKYYLDKICKNHLLLLHGNFDNTEYYPYVL